MSLKYALLGFLNYESMSGYQLKKHFDYSVSQFWNASLSQIYPTLVKLNELELVEVEIIHQDTAPNTKIYHITEQGKEALNHWLSQSYDLPYTRSSLLVKIFFSSNIDPKNVIDHLEQLVILSKQKLEGLEDKKKHIVDEHLTQSYMKEESLYWSLTADYGIKQELFFIKWCEHCIHKLKKSIENRKKNNDSNMEKR